LVNRYPPAAFRLPAPRIFLRVGRIGIRALVLVVVTAVGTLSWTAAQADDSTTTTSPVSSPSSMPTTTTVPPTTTTTPGSSDDAAREAIDLNRATQRLQDVNRQVATVQDQTTAAQTELQILDDAIKADGVQIAAVRARLADAAATAYQRHGAAYSGAMSVSHVQDLTTADIYAGAIGNVDTTQLTQLTNQQDALEQTRAQRASEQDSANATLSKLEAEATQLTNESAQDQSDLDRRGALTVMGDSRLSAPQLVAWYRSTGATPNLAPGTTIDDLAAMYVEEGNAEHVRGDVAFAQSIIETASFSVDAGNNYAGIGACDSCSGGLVFPTPRDGVRAQIQLLRNYADPDSRASNLAHPPEPGLYGVDATTAAKLYDTFFLKGKVPLWNQMGHGNWATDPTYAGKILALYERMVAFAG
jgi:hypothetical protein